jgi:predicted nucleic acid-binding Zn finger protein
MTTTKRQPKQWNPTVRLARRSGRVVALVTSESEAGRIYTCEQGECSCPQFQYRLRGTGHECKHLEAARLYCLWLRSERKAIAA